MTVPSNPTPATLDAADARWSRPFRVVFPDGYVLHGVEFPSGRVVLDDLVSGLVEAATAIEHLRLPGELGQIVWADDQLAQAHAAGTAEGAAAERERIALAIEARAAALEVDFELDDLLAEELAALADAASIARTGEVDR